MNKILLILSKIIIFLFLLSCYSFVVKKVVNGSQKLGLLTKPLREFIDFPANMKGLYDAIKGLSYYDVEVAADFEPINQLDRDLYGLNARLDRSNGRYIFELKNLRNNTVHLSWEFLGSNFIGTKEEFPASAPQNPILLNDSSIVCMFYGTKNLFRLDKNSNLLWVNNEFKFHHSLNMDDQHLWAIGWVDSHALNSHSNSVAQFKDDILLKIDIKTGEVLYKKLLSEIFVENGYPSMVVGYVNQEYEKGIDVFHLNDIQPIMSDGAFWKKGDLLLSARHRSCIVQYRPSTNEIIRIISGPFISQHDVDIVSDSVISIFNNNRSFNFAMKGGIDQMQESAVLDLKSSNIVLYDFKQDSFSYYHLPTFQDEKIYTPRQGTHEFLSNGDLFVESTEVGLTYVIRDGTIIYKSYVNEIKNGIVEYPHWMRIYEDLDFLTN